jgi:malate dehydrogenase (oxaloacetate-decarboxylating)(NADP+)
MTSNVDIAAIEEGIKAASLDQLRGYAQNHYAQVSQDKETEYISRTMAAGYPLLRQPFWNKGK